MPVAVVTDSTCDLTPELAKSLGIEMVPIQVNFGEEQFLDGVNLSRAQFYAKFAQARDLPVSAPPTVRQWVDIFQKHLSAGKEVVCPVVSSALSETYKNASAALAQVGSDKVVLVDSKTLSGGLGLQAILAAELATAGKSAAEIGRALGDFRSTQHGFCTLPDLAHLGRSGRLGKAQVMLGTVMKIIPILRVNPDGVVEGEAQTRTFEKAQELIVEIAMRHIPRPANTRIIVIHAHVPDLGEKIAANLRGKLTAPPKYLLVTESGSAIAVNAGPGAVAIFSAEG